MRFFVKSEFMEFDFSLKINGGNIDRAGDHLKTDLNLRVVDAQVEAAGGRAVSSCVATEKRFFE